MYLTVISNIKYTNITERARTRKYFYQEIIKRQTFLFQYLQEVEKWKIACEDVHIPDSVQELEDAISAHQSLIESITQAYTEVGGLIIKLF